MSFIEVRNLKYRYPHTEHLALDGLDFKVEKGEFIGIAGKNKSGKSTLCQAMVGLVPTMFGGAYGGSLVVDGLDAAKTPIAQLCQRVGLIFQNPFNQLSGAKDTVFEEVAFGLQNLGVPRDEIFIRAEESLREMGMDRYRDRNPFDLSGGQIQRVAIASILAMHPDVIVLDEPTSQLDPKGSEEVFRVVEKLAAAGITIIMVEQKMEKLAAYCDKILLLHEGRQAAFDTPEQIFSRDDLPELGMMPPVYTQVCRAMDVAAGDGLYPVTEEQTVALRSRFPAVPPSGKDDGDGGMAEPCEGTGESPPCSAGGRAVPCEGVGESAQHDAGGAASCRGIGETNPCGTPYEAIFRIRDLDFWYQEGSPVLSGLSLSLDARPTAIIGENGAGKTTLVKLLKGLLRPVSGEIICDGEDLAERTVAQLAGKVGYVFQNPDDQIFKNKVLDEVMVGPLNLGMGKPEAEKAAVAALQMVGLEASQSENPYDLELSERKLLAIASVLAMDTRVIILDEPTIAQDAPGRSVIGRLVHELSAQGKFVISILHDMDFVAEYFERVIVMAHGRVLADGPKEEVFYEEQALGQACLEQPHVTSLSRLLGYDGAYMTVKDLSGNGKG